MRGNDRGKRRVGPGRGGGVAAERWLEGDWVLLGVAGSCFLQDRPILFDLWEETMQDERSYGYTRDIVYRIVKV